MARRCGAKHICKSKCTKHHTPHSRSHFGSSDLEKWHAAAARSTFSSQNVPNTSTPHLRSHFGSSDLEKWHAAVTRSTFRRQNAQNTTCSRHFLKLRCPKIAQRCGEKHIYKSKMCKIVVFWHTFGCFHLPHELIT